MAYGLCLCMVCNGQKILQKRKITIQESGGHFGTFGQVKKMLTGFYIVGCLGGIWGGRLGVKAQHTCSILIILENLFI